MFWAAAAGLAVMAAHAATVPIDAWLPVNVDGTAIGPAFLTPPSGGAPWLFSVHAALAAVLVWLPWPARLGWTPLLLTAIAIVLMSRTFRRLGLPGLPAAVLSLVAAGGPLIWAQATSPFGAAAGTTVAAGLSLMMAARPGPTPVAAGALALVATAVLAWAGPPDPGAVTGVVGELGGIGIGLVALALVGSLAERRLAGGVRDAASPWMSAALGAGLWALMTPLGAVTQVAVILPCAWALVATGLLRLLAWRQRPAGARTVAWLVLAMSAWAGVQALGRPWTARHETTVLARQWARAAGRAAHDAPLVTDATPASALVEAWLRGTSAFDARVPFDALPHTPSAAPARFTLLPALADAGRWMGLAPASAPARLSTLAEIAAALPADVVVAVGLSQDATSRLTPDAWQALAALGSRSGPGGTARARASVGVTGGRAAGAESAASPRTSLVLLPGDLIGQTGRPSPLDLRIEADATDVRLFERDRLRAAAPGVAVAVYRRTGARLALWIGPDTGSLSASVPGSDGPLVRHVDALLPCRELPAETDADLTLLAIDGALGVAAPAGTRVRVSTTWPEGHPSAAPQIVGDIRPGADAEAVLDANVEATPFGIMLRGRPAMVRWRADGPARVCQAPPIQPTTGGGATAEVAVHPRVESAFGGGWHDMEPMGDGRYFRWMSGPRARLLFAVATADAVAGALTFTLDSQSVGNPVLTDRLRLAVNGSWLDDRVLPAGRGLQTWTLPGALLRSGLNEILIETTVTIRPSDRQAGADARLLGLAVYGWRLASDDAAASPRPVPPAS